MPRGVYPRKPVATTGRAVPEPSPPAPDDGVLYPVEGNPSACPGPLCPECFSDGWPSESTSAGCAHGMWIREMQPTQEVDF